RIAACRAYAQYTVVNGVDICAQHRPTRSQGGAVEIVLIPVNCGPGVGGQERLRMRNPEEDQCNQTNAAKLWSHECRENVTFPPQKPALVGERQSNTRTGAAIRS